MWVNRGSHFSYLLRGNTHIFFTYTKLGFMCEERELAESYFFLNTMWMGHDVCHMSLQSQGCFVRLSKSCGL